MHTVIKLMISIMVIMGCGFDSDSGTHRSLDALIVLPGAQDVRKKENDDTVQIFYKLHQPYPASETIKLVENQLKSMGWTPLQYNELNLNAPTSLVTGWSVSSNPRKGTGDEVHIWDSVWKNTQGDYVKYLFQYFSPKARINEQELLFVAVNWVPSNTANKIKIKKNKMTEMLEKKKQNQ